jgi:antitoxin YefM
MRLARLYRVVYKFAPMSHVSFTAFRQHMARYFDQVSEDREPLFITRQGKANLVIMSEAEFAGWQETVYLLSSPKNAERLAASVRQARAGGAREHELVVPAPQASEPA